MLEERQKSDLHANRKIYFLSNYMVFSTRLLAYISGWFFFVVINPSLESLPIGGNYVVFILGIVSYELASLIAEKTYKPRFDYGRIAKEDSEFTEKLEKLILKLGYLFVTDLIFAILIYALFELPDTFIAPILLGFFGSLAAVMHLFGTSFLIMIFHPYNSFKNSFTLMFMAAILLFPGYFYVGFAIYTYLKHSVNLGI